MRLLNRVLLFVVVFQIAATGGLFAESILEADQGIKTEIGMVWITIKWKTDRLDDRYWNNEPYHDFYMDHYYANTPVFALSKFWFIYEGDSLLIQPYTEISTLQESTNEKQMGFSSFIGGLRFMLSGNFNTKGFFFFNLAGSYFDFFVCTERIKENTGENCLVVDVNDSGFVGIFSMGMNLSNILEFSIAGTTYLSPIKNEVAGRKFSYQVTQNKLVFTFFF